MGVGQPFDTVKVSVCIYIHIGSLERFVTSVQFIQHSRTGKATDGRVGREESVPRSLPLLLTYS